MSEPFRFYGTVLNSIPIVYFILTEQFAFQWNC